MADEFELPAMPELDGVPGPELSSRAEELNARWGELQQQATNAGLGPKELTRTAATAIHFKDDCMQMQLLADASADETKRTAAAAFAVRYFTLINGTMEAELKEKLQ